jgi:hypothetical protein
MIGWILGLVTSAGNTVAGLAATTAQKILGLYNFVIGFFLRVKAAVVAARAAVMAWIAAMVAHAVAIANAVRFIVTQLIPKLLAALEAKVRAWVSGLIAFTQTLARQLIAAAEARLLAGLAKLRQLNQALQNWATSQFVSAVSRLNRLEARVFGLLATPERVVAWILGALTKALGRWALDNAGRLGRQLFRWALGGAAGAAHLIEDIIVRII